MTGETGAAVLRRVLEAVRVRTPEDATVERLTAGSNQLLVETDRGRKRVGGVAHRPDGDLPAVEGGTDAFAVAGWAADRSRTPASRAVAIACLNALSAPLVEWRVGDPMAALSGDVEAIATVGLFRPAFRKFDAIDVRVIEREPVERVDAPPDVTVSTFEPGEADQAIDGVDICFITGSALVYGGLDRYLRAARDVPTVVLIGATASFFPAPAFEAGVSMLAGARVTDIEAVRSGIEAGACGTDLHDAGLEKVYVASRERLHGLDLVDEPSG